MTWFHCNKCGNPIMHMQVGNFKSPSEAEQYTITMKLLKDSIVCKCCADPDSRNCEECKVYDECKIKDKKKL